MVNLKVHTEFSAPPVVTASLGSKDCLKRWHVRLKSQNHIGRGEALLWPNFVQDDDTVETDFERLTVEIESLSHIDEIPNWLDHAQISSLCRYAVELAYFNLIASIEGKCLADYLWDSYSETIPCHRLISSWQTLFERPQTPDEAIKIKGGTLEPADEYSLFSAVLDKHPQLNLRIDANGSWDLAHAQRMCMLAERQPQIIVEQPLSAERFEDLDLLQRQTKTRIALDESMALDPSACLDTACLGVVLKPMYCGGLLRSKALYETMVSTKEDICITHALEGAIGRAGAQHLAAGIPTRTAHGVSDLVYRPFVTLRQSLEFGDVQ